MNQLLAITVLLAGALATAAHAGLNLDWKDCGTGIRDQTLACFGQAEEHVIHASIRLPEDMPAFVAFDAEFRLVGEPDVPLPDFWNLAGGECNDGGAFLDPDPRAPGCVGTSRILCAGPPETCSGGVSFHTGWSGVHVSRVTMAVHRPSPVALVSGTTYFLARIAFSTAHAVENGGACVGCRSPADLILQRASFFGADGQEVVIDGSGSVNDLITFNCGTLCLPTPTTNTTWGLIKSLYR